MMMKKKSKIDLLLYNNENLTTAETPNLAANKTKYMWKIINKKIKEKM